MQQYCDVTERHVSLAQFSVQLQQRSKRLLADLRSELHQPLVPGFRDRIRRRLGASVRRRFHLLAAPPRTAERLHRQRLVCHVYNG